MDIDIQIIPHDLQRYETCGDWEFETEEYTPDYQNVKTRTTLKINVSETGNENSNFLIALHEMIEAYLCRNEDITQEIVDKWDMNHLDSDDPGSISGCPYKFQHLAAENIERQVCSHLGMYWRDHDALVTSLRKK